MTDWFREGAGTVTTNNKEPIDQVCIWELMPPHLFGEKFHKNKSLEKKLKIAFFEKMWYYFWLSLKEDA